MPDAPPLTLLILAGGGSSRMGRDKAAIPFPAEGAPPLVARVHLILRPLATACLLAAGTDFGLGCQLVTDEPGFPGPLGGLLAGLAAAPTELVLAVAADTPFPAPELALGLIAVARDNPRVALAAPLRGGRVEPLFAVYRRRAGPSLRGVEQRPGERGVPLRRAIAELPRVEVAESTWRSWDPGATSFINCNTPEELAAARAAALDADQGGLT